MNLSPLETALLELVPCCVATGVAVRDANGDIVDFETVFINEFGRDMFPALRELPSLWSVSLPGAHDGAMFGRFVNVVETGESWHLPFTDRGPFTSHHNAVFADIHVKKHGDGYVAAWRNIAHERRQRAELEMSQRLLSDVIALADQPVGRTDKAGLLVWCNQTYLRLTGEQHMDDAIGRPVWELFQTIATAKDSDPTDLRLMGLARHLDDNDVHHLVGEFGNRFGETRHMEFISRAILNDHGEIEGYQFVGSDITKWQETNTALRDINKLLARSRELERQRVAAQLHENALQKLVAATWELAGSSCENDAASLINDAIGGVHQLLQEYAPSQASLQPVQYLVQEQLEALQSSGVHLDVSLEQPATEASLVLASKVLIVALENVLVHARATRASVSMTVDDEWVRVEVEDDGVGFDEVQADRAAAAGRLSLLHLGALVDANDGTFQVYRTSDRGTTVFVRIPARMDIFK